tara:strand:+ start:570 stop:692 length:123 start_codon:yes stop_codon:yes gene_type:complete
MNNKINMNVQGLFAFLLIYRKSKKKKYSYFAKKNKYFLKE